MTNISIFARRALRGGAALQALALLGAGVGVAAVAAPAAAQDYTQVSATGRVQGSNGQPISGATVTVRSDDQGFERSTTTDGAGGFSIPALPQGSYSFEVSAPGFTTFNDTGVPLRQNASSNQFTLAPEGATGGDIVVTAGRVARADFDRTTTGSVINLGELAARVPVARDIASVIQLSPGTTQGDQAFGNLANISGSSVAENAFYVNGLNITNFRTGLGAVAVPFDFYQTVEVKNGGFQAEFGRTTGGVVNATTKSGSNTFHGGVTFNWEPDDLRADAPSTLTQDNDAREIDRTDMIAQLSGPIIKDHVFFYALYNARNITSAQAVTALQSGTTPANPTILGSQYVYDRTTSPYWGGKLDVVITDGQRLEGTFFDTRNETARRIYGTAAQAAVAGGRRYNPVTNDPGTLATTQTLRTGGINFVGRYTGSFTDWLTLSAAYGQNRDRDITDAALTTSSVLDQRGGANQSIGNPTSNGSANEDRREFYRGDVDLYVNNLLGNHHFRAGYDHEKLSTTIVTRSYGIGQVTLIDGTPANPFGITDGQYAQVRFFQNGGLFETTNEAFYAQDSWTLFDNRLTAQLGIRNDRFTNNNINGEAYYKSGNQWGPRLGFTFDALNDGSTKVYGSYGRYFLPIAASTNNRLGGAELDENAYFRFSGLDSNNVPILTTQLTPTGGQPCITRTGSCIITSDGTAGPTDSLIASNLESQSLDEYILGIERRFGRYLRVNVFGTYRKLNNSLEDAGVNGAIRAYCTANNLNGANSDGRTCQDVYSGAASIQYILLNPGSSATFSLDRPINGETSLRTITLTPDQLGLQRARRSYKAMTFQVVREFDGKWSAEFSYTLSKLVGNTEGGVRSDGTGQSDTGATVDFDFPGLGIGTYGYLPNDRRHNFKLFGSYAFGDTVVLGANLQVTSPKKFGCLGTVPLNIDSDAFTYGANGTFCNLNSDGSVRTSPRATGEVLPARTSVQRGTGLRGDWLVNLGLDAQIKVPTDLFDGFVRVSVFNILNRHDVTDLEERGTVTNGDPRIDYGTITGYSSPRAVRLQVGMNF